MKVDLSIDFDFFVRNEVWGFNYYERFMYLNFFPLWAIRYSEHDLVKESDIDIFADFKPIFIIDKLEEKGFIFTEQTKYFSSESHAGIVEAFKDSFADILINIDSHHDMYERQVDFSVKFDGFDLYCGNWMTYFHNKGFYKNVFIVYPKWKEIENEYKKGKAPYPIVRWNELPKDKYEVQRIFLCRSGCWVPPHHDTTFKQIALILSKKCKQSHTLIGHVNPLIEREIDWKIVENLRRQLEKVKPKSF